MADKCTTGRKICDTNVKVFLLEILKCHWRPKTIENASKSEGGRIILGYPIYEYLLTTTDYSSQPYKTENELRCCYFPTVRGYVP